MPRRKKDAGSADLPGSQVIDQADAGEVDPAPARTPRPERPAAHPLLPARDRPRALSGRRKTIRPPHHTRPTVPFEARPHAPFDVELALDAPADDFGGDSLGHPGGPTVELPVIPLRDMVIFPHMLSQFFVGRDVSVQAVAEAVAGDHHLLAVAQRDPDIDDVTPDDLYSVGVELAIGRALKMPDGTTALLVQGQRRVEITGFTQETPYFRARGRVIAEPAEPSLASEAMMRAVLALFEKVVKMSPALPEDAYVAALNVDEPGWLADLVASTVSLPTETRQELLALADPSARLQQLSIVLAKEVDVLDLESRIQHEVQKEVDKSQREYYLREQMKAIQHELGEEDLQTREGKDLRAKILAAGMPEEVQQKALDELERLQLMPGMAPEVGIIRTYLDWLADLPWTQRTTDRLDLAEAARTLEANHYGLPRVKERILEYMAVRRLAQGRLRAPILCFVGPPGVGKTSLGRSIAQVLGRKFVRISLGGIRDEAEIRGHRRTYIGALPGRIIQTMRTAGTVNPVFMLDEIDKLGADFRGDPSAALLEVLDPEQNHAFSDHYLDVPYNLSHVLFIMTANQLDPVPDALLDRMEVIELPGYTEEEKFHIARNFLIPRQVSEHGLLLEQVRFTEGAVTNTIREYTHEAGVRNLEREIGSICRKIARGVVEALPPVAAGEEAPPLPLGGTGRHFLVREATLPHFLGPPRYSWGTTEQADEVGLATGVSWTPVGGDTMGVEVTVMEGRGNLLLTGQLGDVMKESAQAGLSYARSWALRYGIDAQRFEKLDIHIHVPAGAIPKDGPSAGVTMTTALISALTRRPVRREVAMTGEITLRGKVLPVGGVKDKVLAAHRAGITTMVLPRKNQKDLNEIPARVRRKLRFVLVEDMSEVLRAALRAEAVPTADPERGVPPPAG